MVTPPVDGAPPSPAQRRRYRSPHREHQAAATRAAVLTAAAELFSARGWAATSVRDVARAAGVSVETVYSGFGSKIELLLAAVDVGVVGDDDPVALADRDEFGALAAGSQRDRAAGAARLARRINGRTAALHRALREASGSDPGAAERLRQVEERRRDTVEQGLELITGRAASGEQRDGIWALTSVEVYQLLTETSGWSPQQYETWLGDTIPRLLEAGHAARDVPQEP